MDAVDDVLARWLTPEGVRLWWDWPRDDWGGMTPRELWHIHPSNARLVMRLARAGLDSGGA